MTINLISDVHATLDPENGFEVLYAQRQKYTFEQCKKSIEALVEFAYSNKIDTTKVHVLSEAEKYLYKLSPKNHQEYLKLVDSVADKFKKIDSLKINERELLVDELVGIIHWHFILQELPSQRGLPAISNPSIKDVAGWVSKTFKTFDPSKLESADYLVIAGDLGVLPTEPTILEDIKKKTVGKFKKILYIAGNHSHWWHKIPGLSEERPDSIDLANDYYEYADKDWLFLGCTLWSPIPEKARWRIERNMNDYNYIPYFNAKACNQQFEIQSSWLRHKVETNKDKKIVIFTHHQPFKECILYDVKHYDPWSSSNVAEAYADLDDSLADINHAGNIKAWLCGHTHMPFDQIVHGIRVVRNPIGYSDFYLYNTGDSECDPTNWYNKVIDLGN